MMYLRTVGTLMRKKNVTLIRMYGLNKKNESVCLRITGFTPFVYLELPTNIEWSTGKAQVLFSTLKELLGRSKPLSSKLIYKNKLYGAYVNYDGKRKEFPFLFLRFSTT